MSIEHSQNEPQLPTPEVFWRWARNTSRPVVGWCAIALGGLVILMGYLGVSREVFVGRQLPYLISAGLGGISLVIVGSALVGTEDLRRIERVEEMVEALYTLFLARGPELPSAPTASMPADALAVEAPAAKNGRPPKAVALPEASFYHAAFCPFVDGKLEASTVTTATIRRRHLSPCPVCSPLSATTSGSF